MNTSRTAVAIFALAAFARPQGLEAVEPPLAAELPALLAQSAWRLDATPWTPAVDRGAFPIGNGHVFAAAGPGLRANSLLGVTGPDYGAAMFGGVGIGLSDAEGAPVPLPRQRVRRVLDAGFVVTEDASEELALRVLWFAPPDETRIVAVVEIDARGPAALEGLLLRLELTEGHTSEGDALWIERPGARARLTIRGTPTDAALAGQVTVGRLEPGATWRGVAEIATFDDATTRQQEPQPADLAAARELATATLAHWTRRLEGTSRYDSDHIRLRDLLRDWRVGMASMQSARTGAFAPLLGSRVATVRGQNGPLLTLLRFRMWDEARRLLEPCWRVACAEGRVPSELPLGGTLPDDQGPRDPEFWRDVEVPPGDIGSWIVLQHFWYWRATRDLEPIVLHWPLLEVCLKKQTRREDVRMPFAGDEPWLTGLASLPADVLGEAPGLIGEDPAGGRRSDSFASAVLFLMSLHAVGDLVDAVDRARNPTAWRDGPPDPAPSTAYTRSAFARMAAIEDRFWQDDLGWFAPALGACGGLPHREPLANANLLPLWVGWTFPSGERSRDNLRNSLAQLWRGGARIGSTRTLGAATGDLQGMLLVALAERDGAARRDVIDALLDSAGPCGEWSTFHGPDGRPLQVPGGSRLDPAVGGVNVDALLFAITGVRQAAYGNWDDEDIRLELRLPRGATWFSARRLSKDGRTLDLSWREETSLLTEAERAANDELAPDRRRDPNIPQRRVKFVVELVEGRPPKGYYDVALNVAGTMFVRYLQPDAPADPGAPDLRRIDEMEFASEDALVFLADRDGTAPAPPPRPREPGERARVLVLSCRNAAAEVFAGLDVTLFDTGLGFAPSELETLMLGRDGRPRHAEVYLDWHHRAPRPAGWNTAYFESDAWPALLDRFRAAGGVVLDPGFVDSVEVDGAELRAGADGTVHLDGGSGRVSVRTVLTADRSREAVLRLGANAPFVVRFGDQTSPGHRGAARAEPDRYAWLVRLAPGANPVEIELEGRDDRGPRELFFRVSDVHGLPLR